jgi:hypothetical protein
MANDVPVIGSGIRAPMRRCPRGADPARASRPEAAIMRVLSTVTLLAALVACSGAAPVVRTATSRS